LKKLKIKLKKEKEKFKNIEEEEKDKGMKEEPENKQNENKSLSQFQSPTLFCLWPEFIFYFLMRAKFFVKLNLSKHIVQMLK